MTTETTFRTAKGTPIRVSIVTERENLADHTVMSPCYELRVEAGGQWLSSVELIEQDAHGLCIRERFARTVGGKLMQTVIPVPAEAHRAIKAIFAEYEAESANRLNEALEADRKFEDGRRELRRVMGPGHFEDEPDWRTSETE